MKLTRFSSCRRIQTRLSVHRQLIPKCWLSQWPYLVNNIKTNFVWCQKIIDQPCMDELHVNKNINKVKLEHCSLAELQKLLWQRGTIEIIVLPSNIGDNNNRLCQLLKALPPGASPAFLTGGGRGWFAGWSWGTSMNEVKKRFSHILLGVWVLVCRGLLGQIAWCKVQFVFFPSTIAWCALPTHP